MHLIDTHLHLDLHEKIDEMINIINENKIYTIAVTNHPKVFEVINKKYNSKYIRFALGMHPELNNISDLNKFKINLTQTKYIGEIGLDFSIKEKSNNEKQIDFFKEAISLCKDKIISIHSRKAEEEVLNILRDYNNNSKIILHWFSGNTTYLKQAINQGYYFSINKSMIQSKKGQKIISIIPLNKILVESDSPFIKMSYYLDLKNIYLQIAILKKIDYYDMTNIIYENFKKLLE